jgi:prepilin-type N-terminal cleavage/methylation domain-containing protein
MKNTRKAFTLVELLVVVAILAILMSLLASGLKGATAKARKAACVSNLKQIGTAWVLYAMDHYDAVAVNSWIGAPTIRDFWKSDETGQNYTLYAGPTDGYLVPYLGAAASVLICPGTTFPQGGKVFGFNSHFNSVPSTYQGFSHWHHTLRNRFANYISSRSEDVWLGWANRGPLPVFTDPILSVPGWTVTPGGAWDQRGLVIHGNTGTLPVLMDDGHVLLFDRSAYPPLWGWWSSDLDPARGYRTQVNEILGL